MNPSYRRIVTGKNVLKPWDLVVQRATNHYWINRGPTPALLIGVLIAAKPA